MVYKVIGLMSGSSLDGLDIVFTQLEEVRGVWSYEVIHAECIPYTDKWIYDLHHAQHLSVSSFLKLNTGYGKYLGEQINAFILKHDLEHNVHFICSHGHTVFHDTANKTTCQIGDGATIAAITGITVINDLRAMDVALGGQGAPIVPIGDKLLFGTYDYWLNIGGIANITLKNNGNYLAFDVCPANQILNILAEREGKIMDENGNMAANGHLLVEILDELNTDAYYKQSPPKSLSNDAAKEMIFPKLMQSNYATADLLHTVGVHIAEQIGNAIKQYPAGKEFSSILVTGGGAFNCFLIENIKKILSGQQLNVVVPDAITVKYKEAIVMALIGTLRWRGELNVLNTVTGATRSSVGGAIWLGS